MRFPAPTPTRHLRWCRGLWQQWHAIGDDFDRAFSFLEAHKEPLLRLIGAEEFLAAPTRMPK